MKQKHRYFCPAITALGLMLMLTSCHDKSRTAELQEELDKAAEKIRTQTAELENANNACNALGQQLRDFGTKKDELAAAATRSTEIRARLTQYREVLEKNVNTLAEAVTKYRREELKP